MEEREVELWNDMKNMEETQVELWNDMENTEENVKWYGKYGRKASWIVKRY